MSEPINDRNWWGYVEFFLLFIILFISPVFAFEGDVKVGVISPSQVKLGTRGMGCSLAMD